MSFERFQVIGEINRLKYNLPQLLLVSALMMLSTISLGVVCYQMVPTLKPILLRATGADPAEIGLIIGTIPQAINFFLCPIISTCSDRTRTRWGRRQPYLILSAPLLALVTAAIAFYGEIAGAVSVFIPQFSGPRLEFWVLAVLIMLFQVLYLFPGSVVYYLIADVIPHKYIGRYFSASMVFNGLVSASFNFFLMKPAVEHTKITFCVIGVLFLLTYFLLFFFVKEGEYPPSEVKKGGGFSLGYLFMFFRQCFSHKIFVLYYFSTGLNQASTTCRSMFNVLFAKETPAQGGLGIDIGTVGKIFGVGGFITIGVSALLGRYLDKYHPIYFYIYGGIFVMIVNVFSYFFVVDALSFCVLAIAMQIMYAVQGAAGGPLGVKLLPPSMYGQFNSANSMVNSVMMLIGSWLGGYVTKIYGYRVMFVWDFVVTALAMTAAVGVLLELKKHGGTKHYIPPEIK